MLILNVSKKKIDGLKPMESKDIKDKKRCDLLLKMYPSEIREIKAGEDICKKDDSVQKALTLMTAKVVALEKENADLKAELAILKGEEDKIKERPVESKGNNKKT